MEDVKLDFAPDALEMVADLAIRRETGARGLRAILEDVMLDIMYDLPAKPEIESVVITRDVILGEGTPELTTAEARKKKA